MKLRFAVAAFAASVLAACNEQAVEIPVPSDGTVDLTVSVSGVTTKVAAEGSEEKVNSLQVFVFGETNKLEAYETGTSSSLTIGILSGNKTIHALVNAPAFTGISDYDDLYSSLSNLDENRTDNFVMEGWKTVEVGKQGASVTIDVNRIVSKVSLLKVENKLAPIYSGMTFRLKRAYLINVAGNKYYGTEEQELDEPQNWYNKMSCTAAGELPELTLSAYNVNVAHSTANETKKNFYCYPNPTAEDTSEKPWSPRFTRLVVEVELDGTLYYYPVTFPNMQQNTQYQVSLAVTRPGSDDPDAPYEPGSATVSIDIREWVDGGTRNETI